MISEKKYDKETQKLSFITDISVNLANAIRRSVLEIPTLAIDEVEISQNDSALYDEILAHRLGLIPIKTDKLNKEIKFKLKEKGPKIVCSNDIKPDVETNYELPITILNEGQELQLVANAKLGIGIEHIKHSPGLIYYKHNIEESLLDFVNIDEEGKLSYDEEELAEKGVSEELIVKIKKLDKINELIFFIESWGQIDAQNIFTRAIEVLDKNLSELSKTVK